MASAASPSTPSGGVSASMWANQPPSKSGWGRNGEPGSAFRGVSRGRPGRGNGRGGRAGRGGGRVAGPTSPRPDNKGAKPNGAQSKETLQSAAAINPPAVSASPSTNEAPSPAPSKASNQSKDSKQRGRKVSEARPPPKVPPIIIEPPHAASSNSPVSATTPNRSRRKRAQNRGAPSISSKKSPSSESSFSHLRPDKSPVMTKDLPPHLAPPPPETPSFDIKHDIDALVERVRAVAMDRPNTPGSHIDWAGDDDDSLPDLEDWGVKSITVKSTSSSVPEQADLISPILAGALKPLPNIEVGSPLLVPSAAPTAETLANAQASQPATASAKAAIADNTPRGKAANSQAILKEKSPVDAIQATAARKSDRRKSDASVKSATASPTAGLAVEQDAAAEKKVSPRQANVPIHPSLPAKPVGAIDALSKRFPRKAPAPVQTPGAAVVVEPAPKSGLSESVHATTPQEQSNNSSPSPEPQGVAASMHASIQSAPSNVNSHSVPPFHPTHGRAHTIGRPNGIRVPFSASQASFLDGHSDERASRRDRINHARTHSSPPTGPGTSTAHSRTVHASRPVITVDALSKLARTLGGGPAPKREAASVTASKE